jgi:hypothetical protein
MSVPAIVARKLDGVDCTEDESCEILAYFDDHDPLTTTSGAYVASLFPLEADQWHGEVEAGYRPR